jgi:dimeric dUTPase (all-alpha-NTP-PPase superfamily)
MKEALLTMLDMQHRMNTRVHAEWIAQNFEWYRAVWIECGELMDHYGYKWWKQQHADIGQVQLEIIDIWHFGMSALFVPGGDIETVADTILAQLQDYQPSGADVRAATETLAQHSLASKSFSAAHFWDLMAAAELDFQQLYTAYVGKNVLNFFRQDHGYQDGSYQKQWQGREDNEHLVDLAAELDSEHPGYSDRLYAALEQRYRECCH